MSEYLGFEPYSESDYYFVSYNSEDADKVGEIAKNLFKKNVPLWYDFGIPYDEKWERVIAEKIKNSKAVILFLTKGILFKEESYVRKEYIMARKYFKKPVYVVVLDNIHEEDVPVDKVPWFIDIRDRQNIDVVNINILDLVSEKIITAIGIKPNESKEVSVPQKSQPIKHESPENSFEPETLKSKNDISSKSEDYGFEDDQFYITLNDFIKDLEEDPQPVSNSFDKAKHDADLTADEEVTEIDLEDFITESFESTSHFEGFRDDLDSTEKAEEKTNKPSKTPQSDDSWLDGVLSEMEKMSGDMYFYGHAGEQQNYKEAVEHYTSAAKFGNADAQYMLSVCYYNGYGVEIDREKGFEYCALAAKNGNADGQYFLGKHYYYKPFGRKNYKKAFEWFSLAANQGHASAQYYLGHINRFGQGTKKDASKAFEWFSLSAKQNNAESQRHLGDFYYYGIKVQKDRKKAFEYYTLAAKNGSATAEERLKKCKF